jgi:ABC-2 type transport system ATP-binding protein
MDAIKTERLTKRYGRARGIESVDLTVREGDFFGFIGPNGAGKSTTIRALLGLLRPTEGRAELFGKDILENRTELLGRIGYLPSEVNFYGGMRVSELLRLSASLRKMNCDEEAKALCHRLDLDPTRKVDALSLGNRKKVGIVCALQHRPSLYILDEPTSGLDPLIQKELYDILTERNRDGATVFLSSHVLSEVERYCRNAAIIREGRILVSDSVERLGHTGVKRVTLKGVTTTPAIEGIRDVQTEDDSIRFLYSGEINLLLEQLVRLSPRDVSLTDPDLEEVFLHYYRREDDRNDATEA